MAILKGGLPASIQMVIVQIQTSLFLLKLDCVCFFDDHLHSNIIMTVSGFAKETSTCSARMLSITCKMITADSVVGVCWFRLECSDSQLDGYLRFVGFNSV